MAYRGNLKRRMERANRIGARAAVILGDDDIAAGVAQVKDLATGAQEAVPLRPHPVPPAMNLALKLDRIAARAEELRAMLSEGISGEAYVKASKELSDIEPVVARIGDLRAAERAQSEAESLLADPEMKDLAEAELYQLKEQIPALEHEIRLALLPKDEADARSAILEIRPAAGGDEAGLFAAELFAMYQKYADSKGWRFEILEYGDTGLGGIKEATAEITGRNVFARLKYESGVHRVQRVPATESQGRIHTSTVTVAVLPEAEEVDVQINEDDLKIDVYRASGAGGQHVNKTESAVRITHLPTGIIVAMQEERSQHKNRAKAMKILRARMYEQQRSSLARHPFRRPQVPGRHRRPQRAHPHLQFPPGPRVRSPHQPDALQDRPGHAGRPRRVHRRADRRRPGRSAGRGGMSFMFAVIPAGDRAPTTELRPCRDRTSASGSRCTTIAQAIRDGAARLRADIADNPRLEARLLLAHALGLTRNDLIRDPNRRVDTSASKPCWRAARRANRSPSSSDTANSGAWNSRSRPRP